MIDQKREVVMPYADIQDPQMVAKMDRCVAAVAKHVDDKASAVAICRKALTEDGKEKKEPSPQAKAIAKKADRKGVTAERIQEAFIDAWNEATMGTPASDLLQKIASRTFGHRTPPELEETEMDWNLLYPMGEMYNITQEGLKKRGYSKDQTVPVYRPYIPSEARPKQWRKGEEVRIMLNPLTSWSTDIKDAATFAAYLASPTAPAFVLKTFIPISAIVSTPETGIGTKDSHEVVLAGGEYEAIIEARYGTGGKEDARWVTIEDRAVLIGGPGQGGGESRPAVRAGVTSARPGKDMEQIRKEMAEFEEMLKQTPVENLKVQLGTGGWEGGSEPTFVTSYEGNGEALKVLARAGKMWNQDGVLVMQRVDEGGEPLSRLSFGQDLSPEQMGAIEKALVRNGLGGWTWGRHEEGTSLMAVNVPQWGGEAESHRQAMANILDTLKQAGLEVQHEEESVLVVTMDEDSYDEYIGGE
jgi:hypothetical protein